MRLGSARADDSAPRTAAWKPALLAGLATLFALGALELALRALAGDLFGRPDLSGAIRMVGSHYPGSHHPRLGWLPTPGAHPQNVWNTTLTIAADGTRSNAAPPPPGLPVLAVGDSFTFGDEVGDSDTWPARLEQELGVPVVNGGVFGYGFDQIALRAEDLLARGPAAALVISIIPVDLQRCEYAYRFAWKPWFRVEEGALVLEGVPVPQPGRAPPEEPAPRRWLRASFLADFVFRRLDPENWLLPDSLRMHRRGVEVAALLVERIDAQSRAHGVPWLLVLEWHPRAQMEQVRGVVARARALGVPVLDLAPLVQDELRSGRAPVEALFSVYQKTPGQPLDVGHMTPRGNALVARAIAERLRGMGIGASAAAAPKG